MYKITVSWAMALFLTDNLNHAKIPFKSFVTTTATVDFVIDDADAIRAENIYKGWIKQ